MTWLQRYRLRYYVRNSMWIFPVVAMVSALLLVRLLPRDGGVLGDGLGGEHRRLAERADCLA